MRAVVVVVVVVTVVAASTSHTGGPIKARQGWQELRKYGSDGRAAGEEAGRQKSRGVLECVQRQKLSLNNLCIYL